MNNEFGPAGIQDIYRLRKSVTRSVSAENPTGAKAQGARATVGTGASSARELGLGWKISPSIHIAPLETVTIMDVTGPGVIQHFWNTVHPDWWRSLVLRVYWDGESMPSIETPLGDFFCNGWCTRSNVNSAPISVNPAGGFNSYWPMPFRKSAKITIENLRDEECRGYYYQVTYAEEEVASDAAYLHAQWRRSNPLPYKTAHTMLDGITGVGHYVGTYLAWGVNNNNWWGEGEIKFYMDGDKDFPSICGTGTEDYFGGAWNFEQPEGTYGVFSTPYLGLSQVISAGARGMYSAQQRFSMYRWHIPDPIRFTEDLKVTIQALGWRSGGRYLPLQDDISSLAVWYQSEPHATYPTFPTKDELEVI
ncbi:MAG: glycoside hydrolase family 172 protein [Chthonomonadales bacterium]